MNTGDHRDAVLENRSLFFTKQPVEFVGLALANQCHSARVAVVENGGTFDACDGLVTAVPRLALAISVADCACIYLYDPVCKVVALLHSGWRGTHGNIAGEALRVMVENFSCKPKNIQAQLSPCISQAYFEVGDDVFTRFPAHYFVQRSPTKWLLNLAKVIVDQLSVAGVQCVNVDDNCTYSNSQDYFSYRRDRERSGRMMGLIVLK